MYIPCRAGLSLSCHQTLNLWLNSSPVLVWWDRICRITWYPKVKTKPPCASISTLQETQRMQWSLYTTSIKNFLKRGKQNSRWTWWYKAFFKEQVIFNLKFEVGTAVEIRPQGQVATFSSKFGWRHKSWELFIRRYYPGTRLNPSQTKWNFPCNKFPRVDARETYCQEGVVPPPQLSI